MLKTFKLFPDDFTQKGIVEIHPLKINDVEFVAHDASGKRTLHLKEGASTVTWAEDMYEDSRFGKLVTIPLNL